MAASQPLRRFKMTLIDIYERVKTTYSEADERLFLNCFNDVVSELETLYGTVEKLLFKGEKETVYDIQDDIDFILPLYHTSICDGVLFYLTSDANYKQEFLRKSNDAYLTYWRNNFKGKRIKPLNWRYEDVHE